jgi:hypothetical protein
MGAVWKAARVSGGTLVVLLAMADWADDDGLGVYPKQQTLADKARMSKRNVAYVLDALEEAGYIERVGKITGGIISWRVENNVAKIAGLQPVAMEVGNGLQTDTSTEPSKEEANASPSKDSGLVLKLREPDTPGSAAAPWLVIELARLMRENDDKIKLPVGLRELMNPAYMSSWTTAWASADARREKLSPVMDKAALLTWLNAMRLLIDADERDPKEVAMVLRWCQRDPFWKGNILGAPKFRKQYAALRARWLEGGSAAAGTRPGDRGPTTTTQLDAMAARQRQQQEDE